MKVTIKDVAERAQVSVATVSRVLNQSKPVSPEIQDKVMRAVNELGFNPNPVARSLVMKKSLLIGVLIPNIANMFFSVLVRGLEEECYKQQYTTLLCNTNGEIDKELHYLNLMKDKYVDGVVILTSSLKEEHIQFFEENPIPVVFASQSNNGGGMFDCINIDDFQAAYDATSFLIKWGHKKIGLLSGPLTDMESGFSRYSGFRKALEEHNLDFYEKWFSEGTYDIYSGFLRGKEILSRKERPTAIFCASDTMAMGLIHAADEIGIRVPDEISVMGFDDIPMAEAFRPGLTTVRQPIFELGAKAAKMLMEQIQKKSNHKKQLKILPHEIVVRKSCLKLL
ncbi:LacI family transcriptional regulator [Microaerobacter geothermalis]|uniref:LacI family DNA-binding transcriptional regulator n=1 Tax=Microaerobacter geothermalis TaxID=674972 RepID=UPI001F357D39|nr:LacI family DNA-binding transcriptional regulator [Microaerobacter geothermalis]MCF6094250.1 LacI family transcriptional regulator [Microaerobacter geothermalis]